MYIIYIIYNIVNVKEKWGVFGFERGQKVCLTVG